MFALPLFLGAGLSGPVVASSRVGGGVGGGVPHIPLVVVATHIKDQMTIWTLPPASVLVTITPINNTPPPLPPPKVYKCGGPFVDIWRWVRGESAIEMQLRPEA